MKKLVNGILVDMTAEEISARQAEEQNAITVKEAEEAAKTARENLKASAKAKLIAGQPLTEEEADTIVL
jgi:hypothetical protein